MNTEQAAPFQQQLITLRRQVLEQLAAQRGGTLGRADAAAEHFGHPEDSRAQVYTERDIEFALGEHETAHLAAIDAALERIQAGSYGECTDCGGDKEQLTKLCRAMRTEFAHEAEAMLSADFLMEFTARHVNKGSALRGLPGKSREVKLPLRRFRRPPPSLESLRDSGGGTLPARRGGPCAGALAWGAPVSCIAGGPDLERAGCIRCGCRVRAMDR